MEGDDGTEMTDGYQGSHTHASRRRFLQATAGVGLIAGGTGTATAHEQSDEAQDDDQQVREVEVKQDAGRLVYWVLPGERRLSKKVFGTPDDPKSLVQPVIERAQKPPVKELLRQFPILVGVPPEGRAVEGGEFTTTTFPTPFSDQGRVVDGEFGLTYVDRVEADSPPPTKTRDELRVDRLRFSDHQNNNYELNFRTLFEPPIPGYRTGGGVFTDRFHHGLTGTGSPLMPKVYTFGASYSIGDVVVNGEVTSERHVIHWMTTQTVRDENYNLVVEEDLPLRPWDTIAGQLHHTHLIVLPVKITRQGTPQYSPLDIPPDQPFIHVMFEEDTVERAPFRPRYPIRFETPTETETPTPARGVEVIDVVGREYTFEPEQITVESGQEVMIRFTNRGTIAHNYSLPTFDVRTKTILPGNTRAVTFTPDQVGEFTYICGVPGHAQEGMRGTLVVTP